MKLVLGLLVALGLNSLAHSSECSLNFVDSQGQAKSFEFGPNGAGELKIQSKFDGRGNNKITLDPETYPLLNATHFVLSYEADQYGDLSYTFETRYRELGKSAFIYAPTTLKKTLNPVRTMNEVRGVAMIGVEEELGEGISLLCEDAE